MISAELQNIVGENSEETSETFEKADIDYDSLGRIKHQKLHSNKVSLCHEYSYLQQDESSLDYVFEDITKIQIDNAGRPALYKNRYSNWNSLNQLVGIENNLIYIYDTNGR